MYKLYQQSMKRAVNTHKLLSVWRDFYELFTSELLENIEEMFLQSKYLDHLKYCLVFILNNNIGGGAAALELSISLECLLKLVDNRSI